MDLRWFAPVPGLKQSGVNGYKNTVTYNSCGNRTVRNEDGTRTTSTYDVANRLPVACNLLGLTTFTHDADSNPRGFVQSILDRTIYLPHACFSSGKRPSRNSANSAETDWMSFRTRGN